MIQPGNKRTELPSRFISGCNNITLYIPDSITTMPAPINYYSDSNMLITANCDSPAIERAKNKMTSGYHVWSEEDGASGPRYRLLHRNPTEQEGQVHTEVKATHVCKNDPSHVESEKVTADRTTVPATCVNPLGYPYLESESQRSGHFQRHGGIQCSVCELRQPAPRCDPVLRNILRGRYFPEQRAGAILPIGSPPPLFLALPPFMFAEPFQIRMAYLP